MEAYSSEDFRFYQMKFFKNQYKMKIAYKMIYNLPILMATFKYRKKNGDSTSERLKFVYLKVSPRIMLSFEKQNVNSFKKNIENNLVRFLNTV